MTRKHFILLADMIRFEPKRTFSAKAIKALAEFCASQNSHFNRERWIAYIRGECGPHGGRR